MTSRRTDRLLGLTLLGLILALGIARFIHLAADPPPALTPSTSIYTDEGYWHRNATWAVLDGRLRIDGDYNPVVVSPVFTLVQSVVLKVFGVGLVQARASVAAFSFATILVLLVGLSWLGVRRPLTVRPSRASLAVLGRFSVHPKKATSVQASRATSVHPSKATLQR